MQVCVIQVPYAMGYEHHSGSKGAQRYVQAGVQRLLESRGMAVTMKLVERGTPFRDTASASSAVNKELAQVVQQAIAAQQLPLVLAGSCDVSLGILAGFDHTRCGVVWVDAHADFNTPDSTVSGFFAGMSLSIITGIAISVSGRRSARAARLPRLPHSCWVCVTFRRRRSVSGWNSQLYPS